jgi:SAM-dependent methyltransferase
MKKKKVYEDDPKSIKYHVKKFFNNNKYRIKDKVVVDFPAGNGITSRIIRDAGGIPLAFDLFPEYFTEPGLECKRANISEGIPMADGSADFLICQEGIEHFTDQFKSLREFSRVLKKDGTCIITTPNYSNLRSRLSYFLSESERFNSIMPPNEIDSIWMNNQEISQEVYFGHVFLIGIQKLRVLASLSGFAIEKIHFVRVKSTSLLLLLINYPFILLSNTITYLKNRNKSKGYDMAFQRKLYKEIYQLSINPKILVDGHLFVEFKKVGDPGNVMQGLKSVHNEFGAT